MIRRLLAVLTCAAVLLVASSAAAHHPVSESGISWVEPVSVVELSGRASSFDFGDGFSGNWQILTLAAEWRLIEQLSLSARVPAVHLSLDDGRRVIGLGDIEASAKYRLVATDHGEFIASAGLGSAFPTGPVELGLGAGHFELSPFVTLSSRPLPWLVIYGAANDKIALGDTDAERIDERAPHGSVVSPHQPHEMDTRLGVALLPTDQLYSSLRVEHTVVFAGRRPGPTRAGFELGWAQRGNYRVAGGVSHPIAGTRRHLFEVHLNAAIFF